MQQVEPHTLDSIADSYFSRALASSLECDINGIMLYKQKITIFTSTGHEKVSKKMKKDQPRKPRCLVGHFFSPRPVPSGLVWLNLLSLRPISHRSRVKFLLKNALTSLV